MQFFVRKMVLLITEMLCSAQNGFHFEGFGPLQAFSSATIFATVKFLLKKPPLLSFGAKIA